MSRSRSTRAASRSTRTTSGSSRPERTTSSACPAGDPPLTPGSRPDPGLSAARGRGKGQGAGIGRDPHGARPADPLPAPAPRSHQASIGDLQPGEEAVVFGEVRSSQTRQLRGRRTLTEVVIGDGGNQLRLTFFNQRWREKQLTPGMELDGARQVRAVPGAASDDRPGCGSGRQPDRSDHSRVSPVGEVRPLDPRSRPVRGGIDQPMPPQVSMTRCRSRCSTATISSTDRRRCSDPSAGIDDGGERGSAAARVRRTVAGAARTGAAEAADRTRNSGDRAHDHR